MTFLFGRGWTYQAEADDGTKGGAGGGEASGGAGDGAGVGELGNDAGHDAGGDGAASPGAGGSDPGTKKGEAPADMKAAIDAALGYKKGPAGEELDPLTGKPKQATEKPVTETETHHANGAPKKNDKGEVLDAEGKVVRAAAQKLKTAAELDLKPEDRRALGTKAQIRFGELINTVKAHEAARTKDAETIRTLGEARDAILGVLEETHTTQDQLSAYLEFNALLQSSNPKDHEAALQMVEAQRAALYKVLGREPEGGGLDLLADFPDLKRQVDEEEITRAAAVEIASGRRARATRDAEVQRQQQQQRQQFQSAEQKKQAAQTALKGIEQWTASLSRSDLDYKAKEDKLLSKVDGVLKNYPPNQWLTTLQLLYEGIEIQKAAPASGRQNQPLRPSGATPGAKAPGNMKEAIDQGLGYAGAGKG